MALSKRSILICLVIFISCQISLISSRSIYALPPPPRILENDDESATEGVNKYLNRESENIKISPATGFLPRGIIMAIGSEQINNWFNLYGVGLGEYQGWFLCDGRNDTPDLRGRFMIGRDILNRESDYSEIGMHGGSSHIQLTQNQIPAHQHDVNIKSSNDGSHSHPYTDVYFIHVVGALDYGLASSPTRNFEIKTAHKTTNESGSHDHQVQGQTSVIGKTEKIDIRNPYYVVAYIIYRGF